MSQVVTQEHRLSDFDEAIRSFAREGYPAVYSGSIIQAFQHILRGPTRSTLTRTEVDLLDDHIVRIYVAGRGPLSSACEAEKLEKGFSGARIWLDRWGTPRAHRVLRNQDLDDLGRAYLKLLLCDLERLCLDERVSGGVLLPTMPTKVERDGCEIIPFPHPCQVPAR